LVFKYNPQRVNGTISGQEGLFVGLTIRRNGPYDGLMYLRNVFGAANLRIEQATEL